MINLSDVEILATICANTLKIRELMNRVSFGPMSRITVEQAKSEGARTGYFLCCLFVCLRVSCFPLMNKCSAHWSWMVNEKFANKCLKSRKNRKIKQFLWKRDDFSRTVQAMLTMLHAICKQNLLCTIYSICIGKVNMRYVKISFECL